MLIRVYENVLPEDALFIRTEVFVKEQGFVDEFDDIDARCMHILGYENNLPIAVCRCFFEDNPTVWHIGRMAVMKDFRKMGLGSAIMTAAEEEIRKRGGAVAELSSQCRAMHFYETLGYAAEGETCLDEGCPHILMKKSL